MAKKYLDYEGLLYFWQKIKNTFVPSTRTVNGKALSSNITLSASDVSALPSSTTIPSAGTGSSYPTMDGTRALGSNAGYARVDHVHPTDTSRAPLASPAFTGTPTAPTAATGTSTTQLATTEFVANTVGAMTSGVSDVQVDGASVVADGVAEISTFTGASTVAGTKGLVPAPSARSDSSARRALLDSAEWTRVGTSFTQPTSGPRTGKLLGTVLGSTGVVPTATTSADGAMSAADKTKLDSLTITNGVIDASNLPSYVDDVIEAYPISGATALSAGWLSTTSGGSALTPETGKIYVLMEDSGDYAANTQFRWGGSAYVKLADGGVSSITNAEIDTIVAA